MKKLTILGATGSIGLSTLRVVEQHPDKYQIFALTAYKNTEELFKLCLKFNPQYIVVVDPFSARIVQQKLEQHSLREIQVMSGVDALSSVAMHSEVDIVVSAIVGGAGLFATFAAVSAGKKILLANKEVLVMSGSLFLESCRVSNATILPIDSEHNAVFQCCPTQLKTIGSSAIASIDDPLTKNFPDPDPKNFLIHDNRVRRIILTASGGPLRSLPLEEMSRVSPEQACAHPNWCMGKKISVDSATMMNKGLELIEAYYLFGLSEPFLDVVIHPQSIVHSMVEFEDGSTLAQMSSPDMRVPIAYALAYPDRINSGVSALNILRIAHLDFEPPDTERFPCLQLAREALRIGGGAPCVLNASNEVAVAEFLSGNLSFTDIFRVNASVFEMLGSTSEPTSLEEVNALDEETRLLAYSQCLRCAA